MRLTPRLLETISQIQKLIKNDMNIVKLDRFIVRVKAGNGGPGLPRHNGVGGDGGDVYFVAQPSLAFTDIKQRLNDRMKIFAEHGGAASKTKLVGHRGKDMMFEVPVGCEIIDRNKTELILKCSQPFKRYLIASGAAGETLDVEIHLKLRPNLGLLGFPNAGKSTLVKALVPEKSIKIADYAFTTIHPQIAFWSDSESSLTLSVADMPGIIEGASRNLGRGYQFLKHLEYADIIVMVVDCCGFQLKNEIDSPIRTVMESVALLNCEIERYKNSLATKPAICVINKVDRLSEMEKQKIEDLAAILRSRGWSKNVDVELKPSIEMKFEHVVQLSAKSGDVAELVKVLNQMKSFVHPLINK